MSDLPKRCDGYAGNANMNASRIISAADRVRHGAGSSVDNPVRYDGRPLPLRHEGGVVIVRHREDTSARGGRASAAECCVTGITADYPPRMLFI
jgi:hypothetical protein